MYKWYEHFGKQNPMYKRLRYTQVKIDNKIHIYYNRHREEWIKKTLKTLKKCGIIIKIKPKKEKLPLLFYCCKCGKELTINPSIDIHWCLYCGQCNHFSRKQKKRFGLRYRSLTEKCAKKGSILSRKWRRMTTKEQKAWKKKNS